jgi:transposase-like protein
MQKRYYQEFKAKVALESVRGEKTLQEIAAKFSVHLNHVSLWKKQLIESAGRLFEKTGKDKNAVGLERKQDELFKQIGQLQVENEFQKKYRIVYGTEPKIMNLTMRNRRSRASAGFWGCRDRRTTTSRRRRRSASS